MPTTAIALYIIKRAQGERDELDWDIILELENLRSGDARELQYIEVAQLAKGERRRRKRRALERIQEDRSVKYNESVLTTDNTEAAEVARAVRYQVCPYRLLCQLSQH
ncbi:hypothetical protein GGP41_007869 [Bipolaris sorokiniana]|uniref:Uncharacterized protein n=1 Tax=Cochliobolus sativus TaxID=45130 RepID=A0A8H5ZQJ3_COCSA|nr:hypothetical protein GGP41_007869 [Bipolaris sorokiniana]